MRGSQQTDPEYKLCSSLSLLHTKLSLVVSQPDGSVESIELEFRPTTACANPHQVVATVDLLHAFLLDTRLLQRQGHYFEIGVHLAIKGLHVEVGRQRRTEIYVDAAIHRLEAAILARILAVADMDGP